MCLLSLKVYFYNLLIRGKVLHITFFLFVNATRSFNFFFIEVYFQEWNRNQFVPYRALHTFVGSVIAFFLLLSVLLAVIFKYICCCCCTETSGRCAMFWTIKMCLLISATSCSWKVIKGNFFKVCFHLELMTRDPTNTVVTGFVCLFDLNVETENFNNINVTFISYVSQSSID